MTYKEKLLDPRWQKKRLEILQRDNFSCCMCCDTKTTLHIHHLSYSSSRNPWDSEEWDMRTLCEACHCLSTHIGQEKEEECFLMQTKKLKFDKISILICIIAPDQKNRCLAIYRYENNEIIMESLITFQMYEVMEEMIKNYREMGFYNYNNG